MRFSHAFALMVSLGATLPVEASFVGLDGGAQADRDATLNHITSSFPATLNPLISTTADEAMIVRDYTVFETLVKTDPDTGEAVCWLCEDFTYDPADKRVVTFKLPKNAKFHDGKPLTAHDVKFSFDVLLHPKVDNINLKSTVGATVFKVDVVDDYTLKVTFKQLKFNNIYSLASVDIIPRHLFPYFEKSPEKFNKDQKFGRRPIGSGPYRFVKWEGDRFVELERNEDWWGFQSPRFKNAFNFKKIRFKFITNDNVQLQAFKKGEFDFMGLASYQYDELRKETGGLKVETLHLEPKISSSFSWIALNSRQSRFADAKTREALGLLTDRKATLEKFSKGLRPMTNGPWGYKSGYQCPPERCPIQPFDPAKAKKLLAEAGWTDSDKDGCLDRTVNGERQDLNFTIMAGEGDYYKNVLGVYVTEMKKAGVCATIRQLDWTASLKLVDDLNFDAHFSGWQNGHPISPRQLFHSESAQKTGSNTPGFVDLEADKLIERFEGEFDEPKRIKIAQELHERIYKAYPAIWHNEGGGCYVGRHKDLLGVEVANYDGSCIYWPRWYKVKK